LNKKSRSIYSRATARDFITIAELCSAMGRGGEFLSVGVVIVLPPPVIARDDTPRPGSTHATRRAKHATPPPPQGAVGVIGY